MANKLFHGRCIICESPARKHPDFCYVHEHYSATSQESIAKARDRHQLERSRGDEQGDRERAATLSRFVLDIDPERDFTGSSPDLMRAVRQNRIDAGLPVHEMGDDDDS